MLSEFDFFDAKLIFLFLSSSYNFSFLSPSFGKLSSSSKTVSSSAKYFVKALQISVFLVPLMT